MTIDSPINGLKPRYYIINRDNQNQHIIVRDNQSKHFGYLRIHVEIS